VICVAPVGLAMSEAIFLPASPPKLTLVMAPAPVALPLPNDYSPTHRGRCQAGRSRAKTVETRQQMVHGNVVVYARLQ
jgi:hypothetical protein